MVRPLAKGHETRIWFGQIPKLMAHNGSKWGGWRKSPLNMKSHSVSVLKESVKLLFINFSSLIRQGVTGKVRQKSVMTEVASPEWSMSS